MITKITTPFTTDKAVALFNSKLEHDEDGQVSYVGYETLFRTGLEIVLEILGDDRGYADFPDPERITRIDHGDYQGTIWFHVAADGYQPYRAWVTSVSYGSCSGCDTLEGALGYGRDPYDVRKDLYTLTLHMLQGLQEV